VIAALLTAVVLAVDEPLPDARDEARAQALMREIRCIQCENEPVSHSTADIARDMRRVIRTQIAEGESNDDIRSYFSERYGEFVLFRPPSEGAGVLIWVFPFAVLAVAGALLALRARRRGGDALAPLPADDRADAADAGGSPR
jgi:cytochrome c-type biogenesis protein CcmH